MRCLSLAAVFKNKGYECIFLTADRSMEALITRSGYGNLCLDAQWRNPEGEMAQLLRLIKEYKPDFLVADSYFVTIPYLEELKRHVYLVCFDDLKPFRYPAHAVINYNLFSADMGYNGLYKGTGTVVMLGPAYAPLREEFRHMPSRHITGIKNILLSSGGADPAGMTLFFLKLAEKENRRDILFHIVIGPLNPAQEEIKRRACLLPNLRVYKNVKRMSALMAGCDLAVSAGGSTLYEICACGTPAITYALADNQIENAVKFESAGYMMYAGDCRAGDSFKKNLAGRINEMLYLDAGKLNEISRREQALVDGRGGERIAEEMMKRICSRSDRL